MKNKRLITTALTIMLGASLFLSCSKDEQQVLEPPMVWKQMGLAGLKVNRLELVGNMLYAITNDGLYIKDVNSENEFKLLGLKGKNLLDIVVFDSNHLLASYRNPTDWQKTEVYETTDGGANWIVKTHDFGQPGAPESITDFFWDNANGMLYATGMGVLAQSADRGVTWQPLWGAWGNLGTGMMVEVNPNQATDIWFGGQGAIENGYLVNRKDGKVTQEWHDLVPNPTVAKKIVFDKRTPQNMYVGWEGELNKTSDSGKTWKTLVERHEGSHFFFGIGISDRDPDLLFTGKWEKGAEQQSLALYYSKDAGKSWKENAYADEKQGGIFDLKVISTESHERIFLALDKGGVYEIVLDRNKI